MTNTCMCVNGRYTLSLPRPTGQVSREREEMDQCVWMCVFGCVCLGQVSREREEMDQCVWMCVFGCVCLDEGVWDR